MFYSSMFTRQSFWAIIICSQLYSSHSCCIRLFNSDVHKSNPAELTAPNGRKAVPVALKIHSWHETTWDSFLLGTGFREELLSDKKFQYLDIPNNDSLVVSTHLKNSSHWGWWSQMLLNIKVIKISSKPHPKWVRWSQTTAVCPFAYLRDNALKCLRLRKAYDIDKKLQDQSRIIQTLWFLILMNYYHLLLRNSFKRLVAAAMPCLRKCPSTGLTNS